MTHTTKGGRWALGAAIALTLGAGGYAAGFAVGNSGDTTTTEPAPLAHAPTQTEEEPPPMPEDEEWPEQPVPENEVDLGARTVEGEPAPQGLIDFVEGMSIPDGAVTVKDATMIPYNEVYYVVAALADTPDGEQILTYLHSPFDQNDIGNGGEMETLSFAAQEWAPGVPVSDDMEAVELGDQLIVGGSS